MGAPRFSVPFPGENRFVRREKGEARWSREGQIRYRPILVNIHIHKSGYHVKEKGGIPA